MSKLLKFMSNFCDIYNIHRQFWGLSTTSPLLKFCMKSYCSIYPLYPKSFSCWNWYNGQNKQDKLEEILRKFKIMSLLTLWFLPLYQFQHEKLLGNWRYILCKTSCKISGVEREWKDLKIDNEHCRYQWNLT